MTGFADQGTPETAPSPDAGESVPTVGAIVAAVAGLAAGWIAAGSVGLLGHSYRHGLTWVALGCVLLAALPKPGRIRPFVLAVAAAIVAAVPMIASDLRPLNILAVVLVLAAAAQGHAGTSKTVLRWSAEAIALLAVYRIAVTSIPLAWLAADALGTALGRIAGALTRQPLWVGATFAGLDFLVVMLYLAVRATIVVVQPSRLPQPAGETPAPQSGVRSVWLRCGLAIGSVLIGQLIYLNALSCAPGIREHLPAASPPGTPWNPHPQPPGFEAAVRRWAYGDPARYEPVVRLVLRGVFAVGQSLREWIPWNVPLLAAVIQALIAWLILRWLARFPVGGKGDRHLLCEAPDGPFRQKVPVTFSADSAPEPVPHPPRAHQRWLLGAGALLAAALPAVVTLSLHGPSLQGKKIVLSEEGFLNWEKPKHGPTSFSYGQYSIGMYGMLPVFLRSLGATAIVSPELSEADMDGAHVLVLIFPDKPWKEGQLERIRRFVDGGGTLLVLGEHTILDTDLLKDQDKELGTQLAVLYEKLKPFQFKRSGATKETIDEIHRQEQELKRPFDLREVMDRFQKASRNGPLNRFNEVLADTDVQVQFDSSTFAIGGWLQSYQPLSHPTSAGIGDATNTFGAVIGASLDVRWPRGLRWPASPLLTGLWGWGDPGNPLNHPSFMAKSDDPSRSEPAYDPGERLGDLVIAAEQRVGNGRVVVFGDTSGFTNGVNIGAHQYISRIFAYLADPAGSPQEPQRQLGGLLIVLALAAVLIVGRSGLGLASAAIVLALSLWACTAATHRAWEILPDGRGRPGTPNNLAYIDEAHLGSFSPESWREDGLMGLCMNLMRDDYLALMLPELRRDRLLVPEVDLGIKVEPVPPDAARQMKIEPGLGVVIAEVERGKAADVAGLKARSVILAVNRQPVASPDEFLGAVDAVPSGKKIVLRVLGREAFPVVITKSTPRARLLISVAPAREFTASERETIRDFVSAGGIFICTVGYENSGPSRRLLEELGFYVGGRRWQWLDRGGESKPIVRYKAGYGTANWDDAVGEPKPLGHFKAPFFFGGDYHAFVRYYAGWPIECDDSDQLRISSIEGIDLPLIVLRRHGQGMVIVVGDTAFAQNRNLENRDGSPFEGMRENAVFWRWFLSLLREGMGEGKQWFPQKSDTVPEGQKAAAPAKPAPSGSQPKPPAKQPEGKPAAAPPDASPKAAPAEEPAEEP